MEIYADGQAWVRPYRDPYSEMDSIIQLKDGLTGVELYSVDRVPLPRLHAEARILEKRAEVGVVDSTPFKEDVIRVGTEIDYYVGGSRGRRGIVMEVYGDGHVWVRPSGHQDSVIDVNEQLTSVAIISPAAAHAHR